MKAFSGSNIWGVMHQFPKKSRKVDALLHLFPIDSPRTLQLLFSFSGFSLPAIFLLQLLFQFLRFFSARRSAATNAKRSGRRPQAPPDATASRPNTKPSPHKTAAGGTLPPAAITHCVILIFFATPNVV